MKPDQIVFGLAPAEDGSKVLVIGVPAAAWEYMKDGKTHELDLRKLGLPFQIILWGGADQEQLLSQISNHNALRGLPTLDLTGASFSITESGRSRN